MLKPSTANKVVNDFRQCGDATQAVKANRSLIEGDMDSHAASIGAAPIPWAMIMRIIVAILAALGPVLNPPGPTPTPGK